MTSVSVIVVTYKTGVRLKECLYALSADPDVGDVVIVDNGNPPDMLDWLRAFEAKCDTVSLITGHGNIGFGAGVNLGVKTTAQEQILVINPDAVIRRGSVPSMQSVAAVLPTPWIVGGKIFDLWGHETRGARRRELTLWRAAASLAGMNTWTLEQTPPPEHAVEMPVISGAFFLTSKASLAVLDGFDEAYFLHVEDVDLCRRCREAGGTVMYDPNAGALHFGSTSDASSKTVAKHKADSLVTYFRKFARSPLEKMLVAIAMPVMRIGMRLSGR
ncbi:MAG: glycosyltransferase family 2 protein [Henriciella sp.]